MESQLADGLFALAIFSGAILCLLGIYCYRTFDEPGVGSFGAFSVLLGVGGIVGGVSGIVAATEQMSNTPLWTDIAFLFWGLSTVPWLLFAVQYTGKYTRVRARTVGLIAAPHGVFALLLVSESLIDSSQSALLQVVGTLVTLHVFFLLIIGVYLVVRTTHEYGHLSLVQGACLGSAAIATFMAVNTAVILLDDVGLTLSVGAYTAGFAGPAALLVFAVFAYDMFESTPAAGTIGEQAIARETEDLVFVVDQHDRVIKLNPRAAETFGVSQTEALGEPVQGVLEASLSELREMETYELNTGVSRRQFDPEVSAFTDQHDRQLGYIVSLHDVTERELRKQRLEVLNRVLRHNLRNSVDVIKSNAEAMNSEEYAEMPTEKHAETIIDSADGLAHLGQKARSIDRFVSRSVRATEQDLTAVVEELIEQSQQNLTNGAKNVSVTFEHPEHAPLLTDWEALRAALESAIENAIKYADESVTITITEYTTGYRITVTDDGPGIPDSELACLDAGKETPLQHGSGLGLWQIKWGVKKLNGTVSFKTESGTAIEMTVPDRSAA